MAYVIGFDLKYYFIPAQCKPRPLEYIYNEYFAQIKQKYITDKALNIRRFNKY